MTAPTPEQTAIMLLDLCDSLAQFKDADDDLLTAARDADGNTVTDREIRDGRALAQQLLGEDFGVELARLRDRFPMCYVEAWQPDDFALEWDDPLAVNIAATLARTFDANCGTNWDTIDAARVAVVGIENLDWERPTQ